MPTLKQLHQSVVLKTCENHGGKHLRINGQTVPRNNKDQFTPKYRTLLTRENLE